MFLKLTDELAIDWSKWTHNYLQISQNFPEFRLLFDGADDVAEYVTYRSYNRILVIRLSYKQFTSFLNESYTHNSSLGCQRPVVVTACAGLLLNLELLPMLAPLVGLPQTKLEPETCANKDYLLTYLTAYLSTLNHMTWCQNFACKLT